MIRILLVLNDGDGTFVFRQSFTATDGYMAGIADLEITFLDGTTATRRSVAANQTVLVDGRLD
jgi:hypothetical protein